MALVLSRQRDETIMIGDDIEVTVVDIRGDKIRLGIKAPKDVTVHRREVYDAIRRENARAAAPAGEPAEAAPQSRECPCGGRMYPWQGHNSGEVPVFRCVRCYSTKPVPRPAAAAGRAG